MADPSAKDMLFGHCFPPHVLSVSRIRHVSIASVTTTQRAKRHPNLWRVYMFTVTTKSSFMVHIWTIFLQFHGIYEMFYAHSKTSLTRTPMAHLPWLIRIRFLVPRKFSWKPKKANINGYFRECFLILSWNECCVYSLESPHRGDSNAYTQHTIIIKKIEKHP